MKIMATYFQSSPHDRLTSRVRVVELLVPVGQQGVALTHYFTDQLGGVRAMQPGLTSRCIHMGVGSEEWHVSPCLVPTHQELSAWIVEETTNVG